MDEPEERGCSGWWSRYASRNEWNVVFAGLLGVHRMAIDCAQDYCKEREEVKKASQGEDRHLPALSRFPENPTTQKSL